MLTLLTILGCASRPPDLLDEMRTAHAESPLLVQCLLANLPVRDPNEIRRAAFNAARARGHVLTTPKAWETAVEDALVHWSVAAPEPPGSTAEANRALCLSGRGLTLRHAVERLAARQTEGDDVRLFLLAATDANVEMPPRLKDAADMFHKYDHCWNDSVEEPALPLARERKRRVSAPPEWDGMRTALAILGSLRSFLLTGAPTWDGIESVHVAQGATYDLLLVGGSARCHLVEDSTVESDLVAWVRPAAEEFTRASFSPPASLLNHDVAFVRADGSTFEVGAVGVWGSWTYHLERTDSGRARARLWEPQWMLVP